MGRKLGEEAALSLPKGRRGFAPASRATGEDADALQGPARNPGCRLRSGRVPRE